MAYNYLFSTTDEQTKQKVWTKGSIVPDSASQNHRKYWSANHLTLWPWMPGIMTMGKRLLLTITIVVFLVICSHPGAPAAQRGGGLPGHVGVATNYYQNNLSKCGDSYITNWTFSDRSGSRVVELKGVKYNTSPIPVSQADRLNGIEDAFESWIEPTAVRQTSSARGDWQAWRDVKTVFRFRFVKANGKWSAVIGGGEISGYMGKYPCDDVPGHPARLAREQAEQILVSRARQVGAVTFKCGPVRDFSGYGTELISVTDASVIGVSGLSDTSVAFIDVQYFSYFDADHLDGPGIWLSDSRPYDGSRWGFRFRGPAAVANRDACYEAIASSYERWRSRFPSLAKLPSLEARVQAAAQKQKDLSKPYLENAAREKGAEKTASGLIYQQIKAGTGAQPKASDIVKVHYSGTLINGKEFDSSIKRGQPAEFPLGQVMPCWTEGVGKMKVGGKAKLVCPSDIGYGDQGRPPIIPGGATLVFEVELLDVNASAK